MPNLCAHFIGGEAVPAVATGATPVFNPSRGEVIAQAPAGGPAEVQKAVEAARKALPAWAETPAVERARILFRYKGLLEGQFENLARLVTREHGKTLDEARGDVRRGIEVVELACGIPSLIMGQALGNVARGIDGQLSLEPVGVCAGITPFNFPAMVPMWMYPLAIACGNAFVLKPSPKVPLTAVRLAEIALEAGLPAGVLNVVHGGREAVDALLVHPDVAAISFVGSTAVAKHIYETGTAHGKRVQAAGGAKNFMIVMPDADLEAATTAIMGAAFGCAGQRCMAGSVAAPVGRAAEPLLKRLSKAATDLKVGPTDEDESAGMGPLIDPLARERVLRCLESGSREGAQLVQDGRAVPLTQQTDGFFVGPSIFDRVRQEMQLAREEIFGPVLSVMRAESLGGAIAWANQSRYGNGAVIFTQDGGAARQFARDIRCGMVGVNVGVPAPMALFPFSGWNQSFFGDLHVQGTEGIRFYTRSKVVLSRWQYDGRRALGW
ncbi:MAG: CoA-acylating methylmalonate-semialdehyde dehydrogenase [Acidobacteria bacterium]|nr:CoA-acylating methylmalonate-semialdehyde dehydrogenase [Acidobacteriota bacterium]